MEGADALAQRTMMEFLPEVVTQWWPPDAKAWVIGV